MSRLHLSHRDRPLYRVVRAGWPDPLDASFSQKAGDRRWNTVGFPALYCCCSVLVARGIARDLLKLAAIEVEDLQPAFRPRLVEVAWRGAVVDVSTAAGVAAAGLPPGYPAGVTKELTRSLASQWHAAGDEGVACRSASLWRLGFSDWTGPCFRWSELAIFVESCGVRPTWTGHRDDPGWLTAALTEAEEG
jgi:hypothetical protein